MLIANFNAGMKCHWDFKAYNGQRGGLSRSLSLGLLRKVMSPTSCGAICAMVEDSKILCRFIYVLKSVYSINDFNRD